MGAWIESQKLDRQGRSIDETWVVEMDAQALHDEITAQIKGTARFVSLSVKYEQTNQGYRPKSARAYVSVTP